MIESYSFGKIRIKGTIYTSDIKIVQQKIFPNWWRKSGHVVSRADIDGFLQNETEIVVLGKGKPGLMKATSELKEYLKNKNIELIEEKTSKAVKTFNRLLKEGKKISAGFHLAC